MPENGLENVPTGLRAGRAEADDAGARGFAGAEASPSGRPVKAPGVCAGRTGRDRFPLAGLEKGRAGRCCFLGGFMAGLAMGEGSKMERKWIDTDLESGSQGFGVNRQTAPATPGVPRLRAASRMCFLPVEHHAARAP